MKYRITHRTAYSYSSQVALCQNEAHLTPRSCNMQTVLEHKILISPQTAAYSERVDFFGNHVAYFAVQQPHTELVVTAISAVELDTDNGQLHFQSNACWEEAVTRIRDQLTPANLEARQYLLDSPMVKASADIADYAAISFPRQRPLVEAVHDLMARIHTDFTYDPGFTEIATPLQHVFEHRRGVCQDFAHLAIACLRTQGLAARYVSGYLETQPPPGQEKLQGADASHAWFAVYDPDVGWLDFDPTNNKIPMHQHITTAWGRDYADITPLKGIVFGGGKHKARVGVDVERI
jgi:transglutaminase-like putative cysteine protease